MSIQEQIVAARLKLVEAERQKRAAWDTDPGNVNMAHVYFNATGFHEMWHRCEHARLQLLALEKLA